MRGFMIIMAVISVSMLFAWQIFVQASMRIA